MEWQERIAWHSERVRCFLSGQPWYPVRSNPTPTVPFQYWLNRTVTLLNSNYTDSTHKSQPATTNVHSHSPLNCDTHAIFIICIKTTENDIQCQSQGSIQYFGLTEYITMC